MKYVLTCLKKLGGGNFFLTFAKNYNNQSFPTILPHLEIILTRAGGTRPFNHFNNHYGNS